MIVSRHGLLTPNQTWESFFSRDGSTLTALLGSPVPRVVRVGVERDAAQAPSAWGPDKNQPASSDSCAVGVFRGFFPSYFRFNSSKWRSGFSAIATPCDGVRPLYEGRRATFAAERPRSAAGP